MRTHTNKKIDKNISSPKGKPIREQQINIMVDKRDWNLNIKRDWNLNIKTWRNKNMAE